MRRFLITILALLSTSLTFAQPKVAINIIIGGMRATDLDRYAENFSNDGFKRLKSGGVTFSECYTNFVPSSDQMALATIATGTLPSMHGISSTLWYDRASNNAVIELFKTAHGEFTTEHFLAQTLAEAVKSSGKNSQAITIAHNASSAISLAGRVSECYWINEYGNWVTDACYAKYCPSWITAYNEVGFNRIYILGRWYGKLVRSKYINTRSTDIEVYDIYSKQKNNQQKKGSNAWVKEMMITPAGNSVLFSFAAKIIEQIVASKENQGHKILNICLDVPRNIVEKYGPDSIEYEDMLYRLDTTLAEFLSHLDKQFSSNKEYILTLTADHGVGQSSISQKQDGFNVKQYEVILNAFLSAKYGQGNWVLSCENGAIYLNRDTIYAKKLSIAQVQNEAATFVMQFRGVANAVTATAMQGGVMSSKSAQLMQNSFYPRRSGDIMYCLQPGYNYINDSKIAQSGSPYNYDRHVPLIFYGGGISSGRISRRVDTSAIAVTIASLLGVTTPDCADGEVLYEIDNR